jgi:hypothetical protein
LERVVSSTPCSVRMDIALEVRIVSCVCLDQA